jgi:hypothetical protein
MSGLSEGRGIGGGDDKETRPILGNLLKEFKEHSQVQMRWNTILLKPHVFHDPSAGDVRYNIIFPRFKI